MLFIKYLLELAGCLFLIAGIALLLSNAGVLTGRFPGIGRGHPPSEDPRPWRIRYMVAARTALIGLVALLLGLTIAVIPSGSAGLRVSQVSGTLPGALSPGLHFVVPLVQQVEVYPVRDRVYRTDAVPKEGQQADVLKVQTKEGLEVGLGVSARYRLDPRRLDHIHANLPQPVDQEVIPPVIASVFRQNSPNYLVRELISSRRGAFLAACNQEIKKKLAEDGIEISEVMIRDVHLPPEYSRGLEGLLLKEQENEKLDIEVEVKQKQVKTAELEAEAEKVREIKQAEAQAQMTVLAAKAQADAMQHTLPLKEKQIEQSRLEAEARKESTLKNAEAAAQAKVIDAKAELERRKLINEADQHRTRLLAEADSEKLTLEAKVLKENPLLIQKIIAERLSDKVQIMMVPTDGKFFFANDVLKGAPLQQRGVSEIETEP